MKLFRACILLIVFCIIALGGNAQKRNAIWCFGDSAGIDFNNLSIPTPIATAMDSRGSCCSISDTSGSLLFYASGSDPLQSPLSELVIVRNAMHQMMPNGDSIVGQIWYQELTITDIPASQNLYYLFSAGVTANDGLYYSVIDMNANGGLGAVLQKNIQLVNFKVVDGMRAIKHANGRDYWVIIRNASSFGNKHYLFLVTPAGITNYSIQGIGSINTTNSGRYAFSKDGTKLAYSNFKGLLEIYDFNRCSGTISNTVTIHPEPPTSPYPNKFWSCEFSPNGEVLYVNTYSNNSTLYLYDLNQPNPALSRMVLDSIPNSLIGMGFLKRAPDDKIYFSMAYECLIAPYCYPYPDSVYNYVNMNLSVINSPDSLGTACDYDPFSFFLGGKRTYYALPNNPDYDLPAVAGSPCDTLVGATETPEISQPALNVFYHKAWEKAFINASNLKGKTGKLLVYDMQGKVIYSEPLRIQHGYYTKDLSMAGFSNGMYLIKIQTEKERLTRKLMVE
jgi:WD40 repeat protein